MIVSCGFKPVHLAKPYFQSCQLICNDEFSEFALQLKRRLVQTNVQISEDAPLIITVDAAFKAIAYNNESSVLARLWNTYYEAEVTLKEGKFTKTLPPFKVERSFYSQPNELFENSEQLKIIKMEMADQLAKQIWQTIIVPFHDN